eukprot:COSAG02_NODE_3684_length_6385_cov_4.179287_5_plen_49_part_00
MLPENVVSKNTLNTKKKKYLQAQHQRGLVSQRANYCVASTLINVTATG